MEIVIEKIIHGGDGMGYAPDGRPVFVPFTAPGETVRVEPGESHKGYLRAKLAEIVDPSAERVAPRCRHFGECGGCQLQHLAYAAQVRAKEAVLREQLQRLGGIADPPLRPALPSPAEWNYRNHVQYAPAAGNRLGFFRRGSHTVLPVEECHLPEPRLLELWKALDWESFPGLRQIGFRASDDGEMIVLEGESGGIPEVCVEAEISAAWLDSHGEPTYLAGGPLRYTVLGRTFTASAGSFFQVNTALIPAMVETVLSLAEPKRGETAFDIYCGTGLFSAFLAERTARLIGIEESPLAAADFEANLDSFDTVELYAAPAEAALEAIRVKPDLAVIDPPRSGLTARAMRALLRSAPARIVMASCDMSTLARDARILAGAGYRPTAVVPIDLFPQTSHLETISRWIKE
ncbi:MAG: class I SAM-dependent RNA methyltransferase [Anaerolineales bacterium]|nr:class I SAM-dependent RNA methyltransferase [Anaerolineales bacterium]